MTQDQASKTGVLLLNMGGPASLDEVEHYIYSLMADPDMVRMPMGWLLQKPFARMVSRRRAPKVRERYGVIGGCSPIGKATARQAESLGEQLGMPVGYAMRYTPPSVSVALQALHAQEVVRIVVIPLYPQYSTVSTLSSLKDYELNVGGHVESRIIDRHYNDPGYLGAMQALLTATLTRIDAQLETQIVFVAHSIPEAYIARGDTYTDEIEATAELVTGRIEPIPPHSLAYQSRVGPVKWRGPTLEEELATLVGNGVQQLVVMPLSFVSENLETLYDLDIVFRQQCVAAGIKAFHRVPALNDSPLYIKALANMVKDETAKWGQSDA